MKIFISHSSYDKWVARQISAQLHNLGHLTFLDEKDIKTGDSIGGEVQSHLIASDHLLLLLTPASVKSHWVFIEIGGARVLGKKIVPILLHVEPNEIPFPISQLLARDINDLDRYFDELNAARNGIKVRKDKKTVLKKQPEGYKVGDIVRVADVDHLTEEDKQQSPKWSKLMDKYSGSITEITGVSANGNVLLSVDNSQFRWAPRWLTRHRE